MRKGDSEEEGKDTIEKEVKGMHDREIGEN
jgi:hypothetical protein